MFILSVEKWAKKFIFLQAPFFSWTKNSQTSSRQSYMKHQSGFQIKFSKAKIVNLISIATFFHIFFSVVCIRSHLLHFENGIGKKRILNNLSIYIPFCYVRQKVMMMLVGDPQHIPLSDFRHPQLKKLRY